MKKFLIFTLILFCATHTFAQLKTIKGTITDENNEPLIGVSIVVKNTSNGTITNVDGQYSIRVDDYDVLVVRYLGYKTVEIPVVKGEYNVQLSEESERLQEVVVVGAGQHQK